MQSGSSALRDATSSSAFSIRASSPALRARSSFASASAQPGAQLGEERVGLDAGRAPSGVNGVAHPLLGGAHLVVDAPHRVARHVPDLVEVGLQFAQRRLRRLRVGDVERCGLGDDRFLLALVLDLLGVALGEGLGPAREERVLRGAEPGPQRVLDVASRSRGRLPLASSDRASRRRCRASRDDPDSSSARCDQLLLGDLRGAALGVELGEVLAAALAERVARRREPLPQRVVGLAGRCP